MAAPLTERAAPIVRGALKGHAMALLALGIVAPGESPAFEPQGGQLPEGRSPVGGPCRAHDRLRHRPSRQRGGDAPGAPYRLQAHADRCRAGRGAARTDTRCSHSSYSSCSGHGGCSAGRRNGDSGFAKFIRDLHSVTKFKIGTLQRRMRWASLSRSLRVCWDCINGSCPGHDSPVLVRQVARILKRHNRLHPVAHLQFFHVARRMVLDGLLAEPQGSSSLFVGQATRY